MKFTFERTVLTMLSLKFIMVGVMMSLIIFLIIQMNEQQIALQERSQKSIATIVSKISDKIDNVQRQSNVLINNQGNLSSNQRQQLIVELENLPAIQAHINQTEGEILSLLHNANVTRR